MDDPNDSTTLASMLRYPPRPLQAEYWHLQTVPDRMRKHHFCRLLWPQMAWYVNSKFSFKDALILETPWLRDFNHAGFRKILPRLRKDWGIIALHLKYFVAATFTDCLLRELCAMDSVRGLIEKWAAVDPKVYREDALQDFQNITIPLDDCAAKNIYHDEYLTMRNLVTEFCTEAGVPQVVVNPTPLDNLAELGNYYARVSEYRSRENEFMKEVAQLKADRDEQMRIISIMALRGMLERLLSNPDRTSITQCWYAFWRATCDFQKSSQKSNRSHPLSRLVHNSNNLNPTALRNLGSELYGELSNEIHQYKGVVKVDKMFNNLHYGQILEALVPQEAKLEDGTIDLKKADREVDWIAHKRTFAGIENASSNRYQPPANMIREPQESPTPHGPARGPSQGRGGYRGRGNDRRS